VRHVGTFISLRPGATPPPPAARQDDVFVLCTPPAQAERDAGECARAVADAVTAWSNEFKPRAVILAGGATARLVCERIGAHGVHLNGELAPGIPFGRLIGGIWDQVPVVTKAGGFGVPSTLLDAVQALGVLSIESTGQP
jgi:uncharacterized protein YgbK (DUF1537 family)